MKVGKKLNNKKMVKKEKNVKEVLRIPGNKKIVCARVRHAQTFWQKFKGLLGEEKKNFDYALIFHLGNESVTAGSIHSLGMKFEFDAVWLDAEQRIVDLKPNFERNVLNYSPKKPAAFIIELPLGTIQKSKLKLGQALNWK